MTSKVIEGHKRSSIFPEYKKIIQNTFIYELILIKKKIMKTFIMKTKIFNFYKYDLKVH